MANNNYNEPAFPDEKNNGLTKLELLSAMAMQAWISTHSQTDCKTPDQWLENPKRIAGNSISYAKALLDKLNKESNAND